MGDRRLKVVLADDDHDDCHLFKMATNELSFKIDLTIVYDGEELVRWLARKKNQLPDIIYLDLNMPKKNGFEALYEIKNNKAYDSISVVVISTSIQEDILDVLYKTGAQYYIVKPSEFSELKKFISASLAPRMQGASTQPSKEAFVLKSNSELVTR